MVGDAKSAGVVGGGECHVVGSGLEMVYDMDGEEGLWGEELSEEKEKTGGVGACGVGDGDEWIRSALWEAASKGRGELGSVNWRHEMNTALS